MRGTNKHKLKDSFSWKYKKYKEGLLLILKVGNDIKNIDFPLGEEW
jgi:hypothetical protein